MTDIDDPKFVFLSEKNFTSVNGLCMAYRNRWWVCHPDTKDILFVHASRGPSRPGSLNEARPQCNAQQEIAIQLQQRLYPWGEVRFVPLVLQPASPRDYA